MEMFVRTSADVPFAPFQTDNSSRQEMVRLGEPFLPLCVRCIQQYASTDLSLHFHAVNVFGGFNHRFRGVGVASVACGYMVRSNNLFNRKTILTFAFSTYAIPVSFLLACVLLLDADRVGHECILW